MANVNFNVVLPSDVKDEGLTDADNRTLADLTAKALEKRSNAIVAEVLRAFAFDKEDASDKRHKKALKRWTAHCVSMLAGHCRSNFGPFLAHELKAARDDKGAAVGNVRSKVEANAQ